MTLTAHFNTLGQSVIPQVMALGMPDLCTITAETVTSGSGGGQVKTGTTNAYTSVPCKYVPKTGSRFTSADKLVSVNVYVVHLPTHTAAGTRINLDPKTHKIIVTARGNEPAKTFRIVSIADKQGVVFEVTAEREN